VQVFIVIQSSDKKGKYPRTTNFVLNIDALGIVKSLNNKPEDNKGYNNYSRCLLNLLLALYFEQRMKKQNIKYGFGYYWIIMSQRHNQQN